MVRKRIVAAITVIVGLIVSLLLNLVTGGTLAPLGPIWFVLVLFVLVSVILAIVSSNERDSKIEKSPTIKLTSNASSSSGIVLSSPTNNSRRSFLQGFFAGIGMLIGGAAFVTGANFLFSLFGSSGSTSRQKNLLLIYQGHSDSIRGVAWSPDRARIASSSEDSTVQVWYLRKNPSRIYTFRVDSDVVYAVTWSPDEKYIALSGVSSKRNAEFWVIDAQTGNAVSVHSTPDLEIYALTWSPRGKYIALGSMGAAFPQHEAFVSVWDATTFHVLYHKKIENVLLLPSAIYAVAWSPDESRIAFGGTNQVVTIWDATTGRGESTYEEHSDTIEAVAWSPDGKYIASGSKDRTVQIWNATTKIQLSVYREHSDAIEAVAWSPDSKYVASGSRDKTVRVWNAKTGTTVYVYQGHSGIVYAVAWSSDGASIVSAGEDKTVQVWKPF